MFEINAKHTAKNVIVTTLLFFTWCSFEVNGQPNAGEIMFVGFDADNSASSDGFSFLVLVDIAPSTTVFFTDNEWNGLSIGGGGAFSTGEGDLSWSPASTTLAGTVITIQSTETLSPTSTTATVTDGTGTMNLSGSGEVVYAYLGTEGAPTSFITAIASGTFAADGSIANTGLTAATDALEISGDNDIMTYNGSTICNSTVAACAAAIATSANWTTDDGTGDQSADATAPDFPADVVASFSGSALPVELTSFYIKKIKPHIEFIWTTASEINNDRFEIEKSNDGNSFELIGSIKGTGNSESITRYSYIYNNPSTGLNYYRLKQIDFDGKFEYLKIISFDYYDDSESFYAYPNPSHDLLNIEFQGVALTSNTVELINNAGKVVLKQAFAKSHKIDIPLAFIPSGFYFVKVTNTNGQFLKKLIKK